MRYYSTNKKSPVVSLAEAVVKGLAPDKGLYMPERIIELPTAFFNNIGNLSLQEISYVVANTLFGEDVPSSDLKDIVYDALNFDIPLVKVADNKYSLELFHGPTLAFKDVGARFMARLLGYFNAQSDDKRPVNVLVATSGDTGSAVANGFLGVEGVRVFVLYPSGKVSKIQESQFTTLGKNIFAIEVDGTFDDCQALVKSAFLDDELNNRHKLTSANSINIARFMPQMFYYFYAYAQLAKQGADLSNVVIAVPSGNFGNITSGLIGKRMGLPVKRFIAANNRNDVFFNYCQSRRYKPLLTLWTSAIRAILLAFSTSTDIRMQLSATTLLAIAITMSKSLKRWQLPMPITTIFLTRTALVDTVLFAKGSVLTRWEYSSKPLILPSLKKPLKAS